MINDMSRREEQRGTRTLPQQVAQQFPSFKNDQYLIVGDQVLIVEKQNRRIVAIVPAQT